MEGNYITREVHDEFAKLMKSENQRLEDENKRQNRRLDALEKVTGQINALTVSVEKMATNMENMLNAIERQGNLIEKQNDRLDKMEKEPAGKWKGIKEKAIETAVVVMVTALTIGAVSLIAQYIK